MSGGGFVTGLVSIGTLVVVASIVYQVVNGKNSVALGNTASTGVTTITKTLFK